MPNKPINPATTQIDEFLKEWDKIGPSMERGISSRLEKGQSATKAVNNTFRELKVPKKFRNSIMGGVISTIEADGTLAITDPIGFRSWYMNKHWSGDPMTLSRKISKIEMKRTVVNTIIDQFKEAKSFRATAKSLTDKQLISGDIAGYMQDVENSARRLMDGKMADVRPYYASIRKASRNINKLAQLGAPTKRLKKAYQAILNASAALDKKGLDRAIERAVRAKARYNAERIARTEMARAYGTGEQTKAMEDDDVIGIEWDLSSRHKIFDICDYNSKADSYDLGPGGYPKNKLPAYPAHPHCLCVLSFIYEGKPKAYDPDQSRKYLYNLNKKQQKALLGVQGRKDFFKDPSTWSKNMKSYVGPKKMPTIPSKFSKYKKKGGEKK